MTHRLEIATGTPAVAAATSPAWLPSAQDNASLLASPIWADLLAPLGVLWLLVQIGFFLREKLFKKTNEKDENHDITE